MLNPEVAASSFDPASQPAFPTTMLLPPHEPSTSDAPWPESLGSHPIFDVPPELKAVCSEDPPRSRALICIRDVDLIVALGNQIRIANLSDTKAGKPRTYKTLHTPNVQFQIEQMVLNPTGKLLAVVGATQVAVVVLPRAPYSRTLSPTIECSSIQIGSYYHLGRSASPCAKVQWHPWGAGGSSLLILTADGILREYDPTVDADEPLQTVSFAKKKARTTGYGIHDVSEAVSFTIGQGQNDWAPFTVYGLMQNGDVYAVCPFMPTKASIEYGYLDVLRIRTLGEQFELGDLDITLYDQQSIYVHSLIKTIPSFENPPHPNQVVPVQRPIIIKVDPVVQGPFLMQPAPDEKELADGFGEGACDLRYVSYRKSQKKAKEASSSPEISLLLIMYQHGRVDICVDLEKVEPVWHSNSVLPRLAIFESVDLGIAATLRSSGKGLQELDQNSVLFQVDPLYPDTVYIYHSLGLHLLQMGEWLETITEVMEKSPQDQDTVAAALEGANPTTVEWVVDTFTGVESSKVTIAGLSVTNDVWVNYTVFALTSTYRIIPIEQQLRVQETPQGATPTSISTPPTSSKPTSADVAPTLTSSTKTPAFATLLVEPYNAPCAPSTLRLPKLPANRVGIDEITNGEQLAQVARALEMLMAQRTATLPILYSIHSRLELMAKEYPRQRAFGAQMLSSLEKLTKERRPETEGRLQALVVRQEEILVRIDRVLQRLMDSYSKELTEYEVKWFKELARMRKEVSGTSDGRSLNARALLAQEQLEMLKPALIRLQEEEERKKRDPESRHTLGTRQMLDIGKRLGTEDVLVQEAMRKAKDLASRFQISHSEGSS